MRTITRNVAIAITAAALMAPLAYAQTEGQPQAEMPSAQSENAPGMMGSNAQGMMGGNAQGMMGGSGQGGMGGMMQGMQDGQMPMMAQMHEMMEACTKMMQAKSDNKNEG